MFQYLFTIIISSCDNNKYFLVDILPGPHKCFFCKHHEHKATSDKEYSKKIIKILEPERISRGYTVKTFGESLRHLGDVFLYSFKRRNRCEFYKIPMVNSRFPGNGFEEMLQNLQWEERKENDFISDSKIESLFLSLSKSPQPF